MRSGRIVVAGCLLLATACMSGPRPVQRPEAFINVSRPERIWITKSNGEQLVVDRPRLFGDTLFGHAAGREEVWFPISDASVVQARQLDRLRTTALIGAGAAGFLYLVSRMSGGGQSADRDIIDRPEMIIFVPLRFLPVR